MRNKFIQKISAAFTFVLLVIPIILIAGKTLSNVCNNTQVIVENSKLESQSFDQNVGQKLLEERAFTQEKTIAERIYSYPSNTCRRIRTGSTEFKQIWEGSSCLLYQMHFNESYK